MSTVAGETRAMLCDAAAAARAASHWPSANAVFNDVSSSGSHFFWPMPSAKSSALFWKVRLRACAGGKNPGCKMSGGNKLAKKLRDPQSNCRWLKLAWGSVLPLIMGQASDSVFVIPGTYRRAFTALMLFFSFSAIIPSTCARRRPL